MPTSSPVTEAAKRRIYLFAGTLASLATLAVWLYALRFGDSTPFNLYGLPAVLLYDLGVTWAIAARRVTPSATEPVTLSVLGLLFCARLLSEVTLPIDVAASFTQERILVLIGLAILSLLVLGTRRAVLAIAALFTLQTAGEVARLVLHGAVTPATLARLAGGQLMLLTILGLLTVLAHYRRWWHDAEGLARTDPLTHVPNRREVQGSLQAALAAPGPVCVLLLDLDRFKALNDAFGHAAGDDVLRKVAELGQARLRPEDTLGRWGGEEFLAVLPGTALEDAVEVAERLRGAIAEHVFPHGARVTVSVGVAQREAGETEAALVERADAAQYAAKRAGRNQVQAAPPGREES